MAIIVVIAVLIIVAIGYYFYSKYETKRLTQKKFENDKLPNPEGKRRCPRCSSMNIYELTAKRIFTNEIITTETGKYRCFDCNFYWEKKDGLDQASKE